MSGGAIQDRYPDVTAHCYGCGRLNDHGLHVRSFWDGSEAVCDFTPAPHHLAFPGFVYGGLLASLIDCHAIGTAAAAAGQAEGRSPDAVLRYVTGSLRVDYLKPTPIGTTLRVRGRAKEIGPRKVVVEAWVEANGVVTARGEVVAVRMPDEMMQRLLAGS